jgi:hypothetical protein
MDELGMISTRVGSTIDHKMVALAWDTLYNTTPITVTSNAAFTNLNTKLLSVFHKNCIHSKLIFTYCSNKSCIDRRQETSCWLQGHYEIKDALLYVRVQLPVKLVMRLMHVYCSEYLKMVAMEYIG